MRQPEQSAGPARACGREKGADVLAGHGLGGLLRRGQHGGDASGGGNGRSLDLGGHPASANARARATYLDAVEVNSPAHQRNSRRARAGGGAVIQRINV